LLEPYYHLVYVEADIDSLKKRDTKGLYKAADQGLINNLIGYSEINPYDKPSDADFVINTNNNTLLNDSKQSLLGFVKSITI
jgi:adenylylsulfate kinase-like enzyme